MADELNPCVRTILCGLSSATLAVLDGYLTQAITTADAYVVQLQAHLAILGITTLPVQATEAAAQQVLSSARAIAGLIPLGLISGCTNLGDMNVNISRFIDQATAEVSRVADDANRLLSLVEEVNLLIDQWQALKEQFEQIKAVIAACGSTGV